MIFYIPSAFGIQQKLIKALNGQLENWNVLYVKLHNYHWNVKGPQFFTLHTKFQELYEEAALHVDEIAERILTRKGTPVATMRDFLANSTIEEASNNETAEVMVDNLINDYNKVLGELKTAMEVAEQHNDQTSADLLLAIYTQNRKTRLDAQCN